MINVYNTLIFTKKEANVTKKDVTVEKVSHKRFGQVIKLSKNPKIRY